MVVGDVAGRFRQARRVLNHLADRYLLAPDRPWFEQPSSLPGRPQVQDVTRMLGFWPGMQAWRETLGRKRTVTAASWLLARYPPR
jgi:hypothetical protein